MSKDSRPFNPLATGMKWSYKDHHFIGYSVAGITTSLVYENASCVFDIGQGLPFNIPRQNYFLTHMHSDHASGIAYLLSQRSMWNLKPAHVYVLPQFVEPLTQIVNIWHKLEDFNFEFNIHPLQTGGRVVIGKDLVIESFPTVHRVPSQGYRAIRTKKKLKPEFARLPEDKLKELRHKKTPIEEVVEEGLFAFTGDTTIEFLENFKTPVKVLFMETTFVDEVKDVASARKWGHTHLEEWAQKAAQIPAEKIVLIHLSARYSTKTVLEYLDKRLPPEVRDKVQVFPRPF